MFSSGSILCLIWGTTWIFIKIGLADLPPIAFSSARFLLSVVILFVIIKLQRHSAAEDRKGMAADRPDRRPAIFDQLQLRLLERAVYHVGPRGGAAGDDHRLRPCCSHGYSCRTSASRRRRSLPLLLGIVGVAVIFIDQLRDRELAGVRRLRRRSSSVPMRPHRHRFSSKQKAASIHPAAFVFCQMLCGLPAIIIYSLIAEGNPLTFQLDVDARSAASLYLAVFGTIAAFWLYYWLLD